MTGDHPAASRVTRARWITAAALGLVALGLLAQLVVRVTSAFGDGPRGPRGSSYAVGPTGVSRYAKLLRDHGHEVARRRRPLDIDSPLDARDALVVLDAPALTAAEGEAIARFVDAGGRALLGGRDPHRWLGSVLADAPAWEPGGQAACRPLVRVAEDVGVTDVVLTSSGHWAGAGATLPFLACDGRVSATVASPGDHGGRLVLLADSGPLENAYIGARDDTALALDLVADRHRVVFDEHVHGFSAADGVGALPFRVQVALILGVVALALAAAARAARPRAHGVAPVAADPPRAAHAAAVGARLARTRDVAGIARPLHRAIRARVTRRAALPWEASADDLRRAAHRLGIAEEHADALLREVEDRRDLVAAGRALAAVADATAGSAGIRSET